MAGLSGDTSTGETVASTPNSASPSGPVLEAVAEPVTQEPAGFDWRRDACVPLAIYAATRVGQLAFLAWLRPANGSSIHTRLLTWDSGWFLNVAQNGYPHAYTYAGGVITGNGLAFFPLYPTLIRAGHTVGLTYGSAALAIAWIAGGVASVLLHALARDLVTAGRFGRFGAAANPRLAGYALVALFCAQPMSVVLSMGYAESLFVALVAGALLAAHRRAWVIAGVLGIAAGLTRPTGAALAVALAIAAAARLFDRRAATSERVIAPIAGLAALLTVPAYILWVGARVGHLTAWFTIQTAGWGTTFDEGRSTWRFVESTIRVGDGWVAFSVVFMLIAATTALVLALKRPGWLPLTAYGVISFVLVVGQAGFYHSKPRLFVPVLLVLVPAALAAGRARPRAAALWLVAYAAFGLWYGAYMITVWHYAI